MNSPYHAKYFAFDLTRRYSADSMEKLAVAVAGAQVDLNPHQVDAALFAFHSPLSKGALLADEVGLGKTIEAGLVIAQKWAERKRRILVITPSNLRKQWHQELSEKFFLPCKIVESRSYNLEAKAGTQPFEDNTTVVICSYQFARTRQNDLRSVSWDIVVIDEAHRLRNVYKPSNVIANALRHALSGVPKILLTATPLQNSLLELYGLISFIDERAFGALRCHHKPCGRDFEYSNQCSIEYSKRGRERRRAAFRFAARTENRANHLRGHSFARKPRYADSHRFAFAKTGSATTDCARSGKTSAKLANGIGGNDTFLRRFGQCRFGYGEDRAVRGAENH